MLLREHWPRQPNLLVEKGSLLLLGELTVGGSSLLLLIIRRDHLLVELVQRCRVLLLLLLWRLLLE